MKFGPVILLIILPLLTSIGLGIFAWIKRNSRVAIPFLFFNFAAAICASAYIFETFSISVSNKMFWNDVRFIGQACIPIILLWLALFYSRQESLFKKKFLWSFSMPVLSVVILLTNNWHQMMYQQRFLEEFNQNAMLLSIPGTWFWVQFLFNLSIFLISIYFLAEQAFKTPQRFRLQPLALILSVLITLIFFTASNLNFSLIAGWDSMLLGYMISGLILFLSLLLYKLPSVLPLSQELIFESIEDGVLVTDEQNILINVNRAARKILNLPSERILGKPAQSIFRNWTTFSRAFQRWGESTFEIPIQVGNEEKFYSIKISAILNEDGKKVGRLIIMHNITSRKSLEEQLRFLAATDELTEIYNRRYFLNLSENEVARAKRSGQQFSLISFDIDHFKRVNDQYGHHIGDLVLRELIKRIKKEIREIDIIGRIGGEEFAITLVECKIDKAVEIATRIRKLVAEKSIPTQVGPIKITISAGVAEYAKWDKNLSDLLVRADKALYRAKEDGRNRITIATYES
ncbi:MAG: diguanylate cyclase [Anaerolineaceae bacterium]|nr:diguanylate cyclase [Anaerolineaceae bacterium]